MANSKQFEPSETQLELVLATTNVHKIREFRSILKEILPIDLLTLRDFPQFVPLPETGKTFEENAILKATHAAKTLNRWVLAEDSGLTVPALDGAPGVFSARYAGPNSTDAENRAKLLHHMEHLLEEDRLAFFECCITLASPEGLKKTALGTCEGYILSEERGGGGFGYDPLFIKHGYSKTFAQIEESTKNRISHRRKALDKMLSTLEQILPSHS